MLSNLQPNQNQTYPTYYSTISSTTCITGHHVSCGKRNHHPNLGLNVAPRAGECNVQRGDLGLPPDIPPGARYSSAASSIASRLCSSGRGGQSHGGVRVVGGEVGQLGEEEGGAGRAAARPPPPPPASSAANSHSTIRTHTAAQ